MEKGGPDCCLRWTNHQPLLQAVCKNLLASEQFADVSLFVAGVRFKCHKFILSACSPYFESIFAEIESESQACIVLKDVALWEMQALLQFIYLGEVTTEEHNLACLFKLAQSLQIRGIGECDAADVVVGNNNPRTSSLEPSAAPEDSDINSSSHSDDRLPSDCQSEYQNPRLVRVESLSNQLYNSSDCSLEDTGNHID